MEITALIVILLLALWFALPVLALLNLVLGLTAKEDRKRYFIRFGVSVALFCGLSVLIFAAILGPSYFRAEDQGQLTGCKSNLKNLATGLEMYATDNKGLYPSDLGKLTPNYLKFICLCPAAQRDTYSASYQVAPDPAAFTLYCQGANHKKASETPPDFPQYNSYEGLIERPR